MVMAIDNRSKSNQCLFSQMNWLKKNEAPADSAPKEVTEYDIYSDSRFTGQVQQPQWPYAFLNAITQGLGTVDVTLVLRVAFYNTDHPFEPDWSKTDDATYHGGWIDDELVSLASLCLGVRLASGGISRWFSGSDPYGQPIKIGKRPPPPFTNTHDTMLPDVRGEHSLSDLNRMESIPRIEAKRYVSLVRACNLYRDALWISEWDGNLAWLLLVSALETGANDIFGSRTDSTKKFVDFVICLLPEPPDARPEGDALRFKWTEQDFSMMLRKVYDYRSRALHDGKPFPAPMLQPPWRQSRTDVAHEVPLMGSGASSLGGTWLRAAIPITLHTFHYITRRVLLRWWACELARGT